MQETVLEAFHLRPATDDELIHKEIIAEDMYCIALLREMIALNPTPMTLIDIGAHIGIFSRMWNRHFPKHLVFCVEPEEHNFQLLQKNCSAPNFRLFPFALSNNTGSAILGTPDPKYTGRWNLKKPIDSSLDRNTKSVEVREINVFLKTINEPNLVLKLDIEGGEYALLEAIHSENWTHIFMIIVEWHQVPMDTSFFRNLGYVLLFHPKRQQRHAVYIRPQLTQQWIEMCLEVKNNIIVNQHTETIQKIQAEGVFSFTNILRRIKNRLKQILKK